MIEDALQADWLGRVGAAVQVNTKLATPTQNRVYTTVAEQYEAQSRGHRSYRADTQHRLASNASAIKPVSAPSPKPANASSCHLAGIGTNLTGLLVRSRSGEIRTGQAGLESLLILAARQTLIIRVYRRYM